MRAQPQQLSLLADLLKRAAAHHQRGEWDDAARLYGNALALQPRNFDALHLHGVLKHQRGQHTEAVRLIGQALAVNPRSASAHIHHGVALAALARHSEALKAFERAIDCKPDYPEAHNNRGNALGALNRHAEALVSFDRALALRADYAEAHNNRGNALRALARPTEALESYDRALMARPSYPDALVNRGKCLATLGQIPAATASVECALLLQPRHHQALKEHGHLLIKSGRFADALASFRRALASQADAETYGGVGHALFLLRRHAEAIAAYDEALMLIPDSVDILLARGNVLYDAQRFADALKDYEKALSLRPDSALGHNNRGTSLRELGRHADALESFDRALALDPHYAETFNNRGNTLVELNRPEEALRDYDAALAVKPDFAFALVNRGNALSYLGRCEAARESFDRALAVDPAMAEAHWNKGLLSLSLGDYASGLDGYEWRWQRGHLLPPRDFRRPLWQGEAIADQTLLLHAEQGFGDSIQMLRYLPHAKAKAAHVILELPESLMPLLGPMADGITVLRRGAALPPFDVQCPLMSLPRAFATRLGTVPATVPYLHVPAERLAPWRQRLKRDARPRVGLAWSGKTTHKNDRNRSIPLARLAPLFALSGIAFVSLQRDYNAADLALIDSLPVERLDSSLGDFADTAAAVEQLDLVIAVDTAVAHLTGALGKPLWLLVAQIQDWRWLRDRDDSPWYPTARLFRQTAIGDWDSVIATLAHALTTHFAD